MTQWENETNHCSICKRKASVWHYQLKDKRPISMCKECLASLVSIFLKHTDLDTTLKFIDEVQKKVSKRKVFGQREET
jgi:hypothetical protein